MCHLGVPETGRGVLEKTTSRKQEY